VNRLAPRAVVLALLVSLSLVSGTAQAQTPSAVGQWVLGPAWDIAPVHMMLLPNGKVMFWPGDYVSGDDPRMWDPVTNTLSSLTKAGYDLFCAGHSFMEDGNIFVPGGNLQTPFVGLPNASIYNPVTNLWTRLPNMNDARWYPTTTTTGTGEVLVMTGMIDGVQLENPLPQVWQPASQTWRSLTNALLKIYNYSWVYWTPFGNAIVAGPRQTTRYLDISGTGAWTNVATFNFPNVRDYGSSVMYDTWNILIAGGGQPPPIQPKSLI
jgi:galactose oxidase